MNEELTCIKLPSLRTELFLQRLKEKRNHLEKEKNDRHSLASRTSGHKRSKRLL
jgi:hypothetical protein